MKKFKFKIGNFFRILNFLFPKTNFLIDNNLF